MSTIPLTPTAGPTPTATLVIGDRVILTEEVKKVFGDEPMTFTERQIVIQGRSVRYYDITFERLAREARMIGQIPTSLSLDGVPATVRVEGLAVYFRTETTSLAIPLLWPVTKYDLPAVPVLLGVPPEANDAGRYENVDWRIGLFHPTTGERLAHYGGYRQVRSDNPLTFDLSSGQFSVCSAFPCGRAYVSAPVRIGAKSMNRLRRRIYAFYTWARRTFPILIPRSHCCGSRRRFGGNTSWTEHLLSR